MATIQPNDRLQPALFDRLIDDAPNNRAKEPRDKRVITRQALRRAVLRDLRWLFNAARPSKDESYAQYSYVSRSVINYGLPPLAGRWASTIESAELEQIVRDAVRDFEPRILASSLEVIAIEGDSALDHHNIKSVQIRGLLWAEPVPLDLLLRADVDLESGTVRIHDPMDPATNGPPVR